MTMINNKQNISSKTTKKNLMTVHQVAEYLRTSVPTIYRYCKNKELTHIQMPGQKLFKEKDLIEFCKKRTIKAD